MNVKYFCKCGNDDRDGGCISASSGEFVCIHCVRKRKEGNVMINCSKCKYRWLDKRWKFCPYCGTKILKDEL